MRQSPTIETNDDPNHFSLSKNAKRRVLYLIGTLSSITITTVGMGIFILRFTYK